MATRKTKLNADILKGWQAIAKFLGQSPAVVERWARESGMPVTRQGRYVVASPEELNRWLGRESGEPVHVATESADLAVDLKRGLSYVRSQRKQERSK
jgi:hypothetical protein